MSAQFIQFTEVNDNEGETWSFWLQYDGNQQAIDDFRDLLDEAEEHADDDEFPYTLTHNIEPESVVDKLVEYADEGYMASHNKVMGVFTCPDTLGEDADYLYKGGITKHFTAVAQ